MDLATLDELEEIAAKSAFAGIRTQNRGGRVGNTGAVRDNLVRASVRVARSKGVAPAPNEPAAVSKPRRASLGRVIGDYRGLVETCRARADELGLSRSEIDRLSGLPSGFAGKLLGKAGLLPGKAHKRMWPVSLELMLGTLGLRLLIIEDEAATARTLALRTPVQANQQRFNNTARLTPKLLPPPSLNRQRRGTTKYD